MKNATASATIMIVEDEAAVRELLVLSLEAQDFQAVAAGNLEEALVCLKSNDVDLLLLDLRLGSESGIDLLKAVRRVPQYAKLPVILLTGCSDRNIVLQVAQLGVQGYLLKDQFSRKELTSRIDQLLKARQAPDAADDNAEPKAKTAALIEAPAVSSRLLRLVKPVLTLQQTIEQVERHGGSANLWPAVATLLRNGAEPEKSAEQITDVIGNCSKIAGGRHFSWELFWEHSLATGLIAAQITRLRNSAQESISFAFTTGLLHDVAQIVFAARLDDIYKRVLDTSERLQLPLEVVESGMLLANHAELAERVLSRASYPKRLVDAVAAHHLAVDSILQLAPQTRADTATLVLADRLAHSFLLGFGANNCHHPTEVLAGALDVPAEAIHLLETQIPAQTQTLMRKLFPGESDAGGYRERSLRKFHESFRPIYISADPAFDAYRILLGRLCKANDASVPNIAILYVARGGDAEAFLSSLRDRQAAAKFKPLPLIVISAVADLILDPTLVAGREYRQLPAPFTLMQLGEMVETLLC